MRQLYIVEGSKDEADEDEEAIVGELKIRQL
jgi:hypothetical protein